MGNNKRGIAYKTGGPRCKKWRIKFSGITYSPGWRKILKTGIKCLKTDNF